MDCNSPAFTSRGVCESHNCCWDETTAPCAGRAQCDCFEKGGSGPPAPPPPPVGPPPAPLTRCYEAGAGGELRVELDALPRVFFVQEAAPAAAAKLDDDEAAPAPQLQSVSWGHWGDGAGAESAPATGGFSWYTRIMDWVQEPYSIQALSIGMGATWMQRVSNDPNTSCACPLDKNTGLCGGSGNESEPRSRANRGNQSADWLMQSMEGGPGLGRTELPTTRTKWRIGDSVGCYHAYTVSLPGLVLLARRSDPLHRPLGFQGAPLFQFGQFGGHACSPKDETPAHPMSMAFIQLSNQMVMFPVRLHGL